MQEAMALVVAAAALMTAAMVLVVAAMVLVVGERLEEEAAISQVGVVQSFLKKEATRACETGL